MNKKKFATIKFDKKIAMRFSKPHYYQSYGEYVRILPKMEQEKFRHSSPRREKVSEKIELYKHILSQKKENIFNILKRIYTKNIKDVLRKNTPKKHTNLFSLVSSIPVLIISYNRIKKNRGATTLGAMLALHKIKRLNPLQKKFIESTKKSPDGITLNTFKIASKLLKEGKYPWGASKRIYIDKPGFPGKLRPITIPPFMDRVIQTAILTVLEAIYEPWFEMENRSFGFRQRKGVHDAIYNLIRRENSGMYTAIEGDIDSAYPSLRRDKMIEILSKRIEDRKFLNLIKQRLNYIYFDTTSNEYIEDKIGLPQGGIDSPYLWNIYMHEFDQHIQEYLTNYLNNINEKVRKDSSDRYILTSTLAKLKYQRISLRKTLKLAKTTTLEILNNEKQTKKSSGLIVRLGKIFKEYEKDLISTKEGKKLPNKAIYNIIKQVRLKRKEILKQPPMDPNKVKLRFVYTRYADDWIILGNFPKMLAEKIREHIKDWLYQNLHLKLSEEKTLITDIRNPRTPAHFLGFIIKTHKNRKLEYITRNNKTFLARTAGSAIKASPDYNRLINRFHMKGFCDKRGRPKSLKWLSTLETFAIIERFNAILIGLGNFYYNFVYKTSLNRWIYIIRYSALHTIAQKYNCSLKKIFLRFGTKLNDSKTIQYTVRNVFKKHGEDQIMEKKWSLLTEKELQERCINKNKFEKIQKNFIDIEYKKIYPLYKDINSPKASIKDDNWIEQIHWVNLRTQASYDLPCSLCGSSVEIHMHHLRHIRKTKYTALSKEKPWLKLLALRNRKQIPVCANCHKRMIHTGKYNGERLANYATVSLENFRPFDGRLINLENYINPAKNEFYSKSLEEKGWKPINKEL